MNDGTTRHRRTPLRSRRHRFPTALIGVVLALVLTACGADDEAPEPDEPSEPEAELETETDSDAADDDADAEEESESAGDISFAGETITAVVGYGPGGGYDTYMRLFAPFLEEELGANVVVENQPGAGSLIAQNVIRTAQPDGTRFLIMNGVGVGSASLGGGEGAEFPLDDFTYLGRITAQPRVMVVSPDSPYETFDDVIEDFENFSAGSTGAGSSDFTDLQVIREVFDAPFDIISGFESSAENALAMQRGDTDGMTGDIDGRLIAIEAGDARPILVIGAERDPNFPDVPTILEYDLDDDARALAQAYVDILELGRPMVGPPDMDPDLAAYLRAAFMRAFENPELEAAAEEQGFPIRALDGETTQELARSIEEGAPQIFRDLMEEAL